MSILEIHDVSIRYMTGDFKDIGLKEYVVRKLKVIIISMNFGRTDISLSP